MKFALQVAEDRHGWSQADLARKLNISDQVISNWGKPERGIPKQEWPHVAKTLGITVEELEGRRLAAPTGDLPAEAAVFAREWYQLSPVLRTQIQALVRSLPKETGQHEGDTRTAPTLQRRRSA